MTTGPGGMEGAGEAVGSRLGSASRRGAGFTLVELLVVVGIIALLVTILMPALSRAMGLARRSVCLANVRRLSIATQLYLRGGDEKFFPHRLPYYPGQPKDAAHAYVNQYGRVNPRWPWFLDQNAGPVINPDTPDFQNAVIMTNDYFLCPAIKDKYARDIRNGAYGFNEGYLGAGFPAPGAVYEPMNFPVPLAAITAPSSTVIFGDSRGAINGPEMTVRQHAYTLDAPRMALSAGVTRFGPHKPQNLDPSVPKKWYHSPAHDRHLGKANVSFVDGHAESMTVQELGYRVDADGIVIRDVGDNTLWTGTNTDEPLSN